MFFQQQIVWFLHYPCSCLVAVPYFSLYSKCYAMSGHTNASFVSRKFIIITLQYSGYIVPLHHTRKVTGNLLHTQAYKMWRNAEISVYGFMGVLR